MVFDAAPALLADVQLPIPGLGGAKAEWWSVLSVGASAGGLPLHEHGAAWLGLASGRKEWAVFAPGAPPPLSQRTAMQPAAEWFGAAGARTCVQPAGTVVLLPEGWHSPGR